MRVERLNITRLPVVILAGIVSLMLPPGALAEDDEGGPAAVEELRPAAGQSDVYLDDSFEADEWIAKAVRQAAAGDWSEASRNLGRAVELHADKLSRVDAGRYISVPARVHELIASWPPEGLRAYRRLADPDARQQLAAARRDRRIETLLAVADRYFCTTAGAEALDLIGQLATEAGDFAVAERAYRRLLDDHPDGGRLRGEASARLAVAYALWGRADRARELAAEAAGVADGGAVHWMGESRAVDELVESLLTEVQPAGQPEAAFQWPTFGGNAGRNRTGDFSALGMRQRNVHVAGRDGRGHCFETVGHRNDDIRLQVFELSGQLHDPHAG